MVYLEDAIELVTPISLDNAMIYGLQKADILVKMGFPDDALPIYKQITKARDSLYTCLLYTSGDISLATNRAQLMYEEAKATDYQFGMVVANQMCIRDSPSIGMKSPIMH